MAGLPRYLWGDSKVDFITFKGRASTASPIGKAGRMFYDSTVGKFKVCEDGTAFVIIDTQN